jgi:hypothetical protein
MSDKAGRFAASHFTAAIVLVCILTLQPAYAVNARAGAGIIKKIAAPFKKPARIILALDASGSMCQEVTQCPGASRNDPTDERLAGASAFVDSVAGKCPECEIGVIVFVGVGNSDSTGERTVDQCLQPQRLKNTTHVSALHRAIDRRRCVGVGKQQVTSRRAKRAFTYTGIAVDSAIKMADLGYDTIVNKMERHIILVSDGDWQRPTPEDLIVAYAAQNPGRRLPVMHGVFISDSASHVANGYPPEGLLSCDSMVSMPVDVSYLKQAVQASGGSYFFASKPQAIAPVFDSLSGLFTFFATDARRSAPPVSRGTAISAFGVRAYDVCGRILTKRPVNYLRAGPVEYQGIFFVIYPDGTVERHLHVSK